MLNLCFKLYHVRFNNVSLTVIQCLIKDTEYTLYVFSELSFFYYLFFIPMENMNGKMRFQNQDCWKKFCHSKKKKKSPFLNVFIIITHT